MRVTIRHFALVTLTLIAAAFAWLDFAKPDMSLALAGPSHKEPAECEIQEAARGGAASDPFTNVVDFTTRGNAQRFERSGWSTPEIFGGSWSIGKDAVLSLPSTPALASARTLVLNLAPASILNRQNIHATIFWNGLQLCAPNVPRKSVEGASANGSLLVECPLEKWSVAPRNELRIHVDDPVQAPDDPRGPLAVAVRSLRFE